MKLANEDPRNSTRIHKGRGAASNLAGRFAVQVSARESDGWQSEEEPLERLLTEAIEEKAKTIISSNRSPDLPFSQSVNPYRGCEHGCIYCYARPAHAYMDLSPGLDFESRIFFKPNAPELLELALRKSGYRCTPIAMGTNTDPYQPLEKEKCITRELLEVMQRFNQPVTIVTKSQLILRDLPILAEMAQDRLAQVAISVTTLDNDLKRKLEPRTAGPSARLRTIEHLSRAGIPTAVMAAPMIPALNDCELEAILKAAKVAGAEYAAYILLRLPHEVAPLFRQWLSTHYPERAAHVMSLVQQSRGGRDYRSDFAQRQSGTGVFAQLLRQRFRVAVNKLGLNLRELKLDCTRFHTPAQAGEQQSLF
ncbi:PA0069 family radical SAM protein [Microbulbifer thermotolerans]|uniref:Radical SAM protein n=1 Tax=Microbulbifer thermotolerans TaxID=252514 RepID=A0A143HKC6_MICTH|nr:PA0069 family radical SAM protein [Microbulbifer thermotolerans]AMX02179.1 radical SAM protein [Microbulbifer thermotolerans]MCX2778850.1 PA0069 family radical SAM protein [Microbulbifer thermotolerans]MCX2793736.1 PA0069 family radical SAM protein [Microbulbifer thermotolerans]MCX2804155.1 PA0069 family radical SAM protein [Microbulbifer thermotolerans]MCX2834712.1 PA0069 family radical SAM protein [Microbulbifer thermotolerans]